MRTCLLFLAGFFCLTDAQAGEKVSEISISGVWLMGQSLCDGSESLPIVTEADTGWGNLMFQCGVRTWTPERNPGKPELRPAELFRLVPLRAQANGGLGETVANGLADHWRARRLGIKKEGSPNPDVRFLVACAGQGGRQIQELSSADLSVDERTPASRRHGGGYYRTSLDDARRAMEQAKAAGGSFRIQALYWMQGEGNGGPSGGIMPTRWDAELPGKEGRLWYRDQLIAYRRKWSADLCAITGQKAELPMFTYQTLGPAGDAQILAADADEAIYLVGPHYAVPSAINSRTTLGRHGDPIHLSADGERWWGEQVGKVMHRVLDEGEEWQPLRPRAAKLETARKGIVFDFMVPRPPLVIDIEFLPLQSIKVEGGFSSLAGFRVRGGDGRLLTLARVEVLPPSGVRIVLQNPLPECETCRVEYGHPFVSDLGTIRSIRKNSDGREELLLNRDCVEELGGLMSEGSFLVTTHTGDVARVPIRSVRTEGDGTALGYEPRELKNGTPFAKGQSVVAQRSFSFGNLRDSDSERAVHVFADEAYGTRKGQAYPLWNWCVLFSDFEVAAP